MYFNVEFFMVVLLPPIIFESGYNLNRKIFLKNIGAILSYAFVGTLVSATVISVLLVLCKFYNLTDLSMKEICAFGSLISATDPVSVLAIMQRMNTELNLHAYIFGESIFNDAVTIVLYRTIVGV